jgi:hypothetical protein
VARKYGDQNGVSRPEKKSVFDRKTDPKNEGSAIADYKDATPGNICRLIVASVASGGGVLFSRTIDGGAFSITLFYGSDRKKVYCPGTEDIDPVLVEWSEFFEGLKDQ